MQFEITILGSGAALPTANRNPSSQYVCCNDRHILIDCGEGTQNQLRRYGIKIQKITHILISHLHGDHFFGLVGLLSSMHLLGRNQGITVYGPIGLDEIIHSQLSIGGHQLGFNLNFIPLDGKTPSVLFEDKRVQIETFPLKHRIPTNGFVIREKPHERSLNGDAFKADGLSLTLIPALRNGEDVVLENGQIVYADDYTFPSKPSLSYAYCSDTKYYEAIISHIDGVTALYHESTFLSDMQQRAKDTMHSTAKEAATIAKKAGVKQLYLGHFSARYGDTIAHVNEAKEVFDEVVAVEDGMVIQLRKG